MTTGGYSRTLKGAAEAGLTMLLPDGAGLAYSTLIGETRANPGLRIALSAAGDVCTPAATPAKDFPVTAGPETTTDSGGGAAFVNRLNATGSDLTDSAFIAVGADGGASITGTTASTDCPATAGPCQAAMSGSADAFATRLAPTGAALTHSAFPDASGSGTRPGSARDAAERAHVVGLTGSSSFPATVGALQPALFGSPAGLDTARCGGLLANTGQ